MAQKKSLALAAPASVSTGAAKGIADIVSAVVQITGIGTGTYQVKVSFDGTTFVNQGAALTADGSLAIPDAALAVRIQCTAYTSGTPAAAVAGVRSTTAL